MEHTTNRRAVIGLMLVKPAIAFGSQANSAIEVGLIGCGSRGIWIGEMFREFAGARVVALHDVFKDRVEAAREKLGAVGDRAYTGYNGYRDLAASRLDAVVIESPPYSHPEQVEAAIGAGKHVYLAKPAAVDVAGCKRILAASEKAQGRLSFWVDFQFRARPVFQECASRIAQGGIGRPVVAQVHYHTSRLPLKSSPGESEGVARLRNWVFDRALSGDIIVEQNIHALDCASWFLNARPVRAYGTGGRMVRTDAGDCWDHFVVTYWYPNDLKVDFSSTQCVKGVNDICVRIYGSGGTAEAHYGGVCRITGDQPWAGPERDDTGRGGTIANIRTFVEAVRGGRVVNNVRESVDSNLVAILGRTAAYRQSVVTWDEMWRSNEAVDARLPEL